MNRFIVAFTALSIGIGVFVLADHSFFSADVSESGWEAFVDTRDQPSVYQYYLDLLDQPSATRRRDALSFVTENWDESHAIVALEVIYLSKEPEVFRPLLKLMEQNTGQRFGYDFGAWYEWIWNQDQNIPANYGDFKGALHKRIDPKFEQYFAGRTDEADIRLDEIRWGGVVQDGIPPLRNPLMVDAQQARYLEDGNVVFGIEVNGELRAYPKRILAWHEMFTDEVGGIPVAGVYCTLCGTVILYKTEHEGKRYDLGTSGFLYRSNKLMYDKATQSLWNTIWGRPVVGPLVGKGIMLEPMSVVTTTWGAWKKRHPDTKVLSLNTGYVRDYREGVAYQEYFATDELMFNVPSIDKSLKNKAEILAIRISQAEVEPLAISARFLSKHPVYHDRIGNVNVVVFTDRSGANRAFNAGNIRFEEYDKKGTAMDSEGIEWSVKEDELVTNDGRRLASLPYHRAFWFGWKAAYPNTRLIK